MTDRLINNILHISQNESVQGIAVLHEPKNLG